MIKSYVYYHGPLTEFTQRPHPEEFVASFRAPWMWLAYARAAAALKSLNSGRCGMRVEDEVTGRVLAHVSATVISVNSWR